ncbi:urea ABC transporter ATP-binding subunit UrtE [Wenyingzhuangia aestuarii]|uniref:urea ABC transporter ATP-binding subunit UrtE n=1 Tax=Wenyingzhuangia aestuarii TaxID=1647582 RepID=UPI001ADB12C4|nr:urea ABC transporter ATP-binding subunit UrtE [Wenyingzhuangia aestuarii]NJB83420.1 urea transport system ATP-binding protein [Wenyingzhuangia aestuarii]
MENTKETILSLQNVEVSYGESQVLWGVDLEVKKGTITTIMGRNGVGKSTTLKTVMGLLGEAKGSISFQGNDINKKQTYKRVRNGIGYVPQGREILPKLTVYENLQIGLEGSLNKKAQIPEEEIYTMFPILKEFRNRMGGNLSGGQQQQLAIARALCGDPTLLLLDEPTEGIQPSIIQEIGEVLKMLVKDKGMTVLLVEQKFDFAKYLTDYFYILDRGRVIKEGASKEINMDELRSYLSV